MFGSPEMMIASFALQQIGASRARAQRSSIAAAQAKQYEQNAKFEELRALQEHNAQVDAFDQYESASRASQAFAVRGSGDRSAAAIRRSGKGKSKQQLDRARVQSLFTVGRQRFAARDTLAAARVANTSSMFNSGVSALDTLYKYNQVTPSED